MCRYCFCFIASEPFIIFERDIEWNNYMAPITWSFTETIRNKILSELGLNYGKSADFSDLVKRRIIVIRGYRNDGTFTDNALTDYTSVTGYWFRKDGTVANYGNGVVCCEFRSDDSGNIEYDKGSIAIHPSNVKNEDAQYCFYLLFSYGDKHVVLKWILNVSAINEWQVVKNSFIAG